MQQVFKICISILNKPFTVLGFKVSLMGFLMFDIIATLVLFCVVKLFDK